MTQTWLEYVALGVVLVLCLAFMINKGRAKFATPKGESPCCGCSGCGDDEAAKTTKINAPAIKGTSGLGEIQRGTP